MQNFNVDISSPSGPLVFYAMQADSLSRFFTLTITDNGAAWDPPSGALWSVRFGAPQMPSGWYDTIKDATQATHQAISVATGTQTVATVEIAEQALSSPGQNILCVLVTDAEGYQIASWPISLSIQPVPGLTAPQVTDYYNLLTGQVAQVLQNAQAAAQSAADAQEYAQQAQQVSQGAVGYYETAAALEAAHPTGEAGNWAIVGDSDTIYVWDTDTNAWVDTGSNIDLSQYYTKTQSDNKYALGTSGVANSAAKIQTPVNIGNASFDGSADLTLAEIGAATAAQGALAEGAMPKSGGAFTGIITGPIAAMTRLQAEDALYFSGSGNYGVKADGAAGYLWTWGLAGLKVTDNAGTPKPVIASNTSGASSRRYKQEIKPLTDAQARLLLQLRPVSFTYIPALHDPGAKYGLIAEELQAIDPTCVYLDGEGRADGINYTMLVPQLIRLCQLLQQQIDALAQRLAALEQPDAAQSAVAQPAAAQPDAAQEAAQADAPDAAAQGGDPDGV